MRCLAKYFAFVNSPILALASINKHISCPYTGILLIAVISCCFTLRGSPSITPYHCFPYGFPHLIPPILQDRRACEGPAFFAFTFITIKKINLKSLMAI